MIRVCGWCGKELGEKEPLEDRSITHGMCDECVENARIRLLYLPDHHLDDLSFEGWYISISGS